jgi:hypothetical protein
MNAALASFVAKGNSSPWKGPSFRIIGAVGGGVEPAVTGSLNGGCDSKIFRMAARCTPASTARRELRSHLVAVERTRKAVVLDSMGPPPEPYCSIVSSGSLSYIYHTTNNFFVRKK